MEENSMKSQIDRTIGLARAKMLAAAFIVVAASMQGAVKNSVFDDVKIWYKGAAGNAVGTADSGNNQICLVKNLPQLSDTSSSMHGGSYYWWGWRMSYENQIVVCPYANVTLDSTPCMTVRSPVTTNSMNTVTINGVEQQQPNITYRTGDVHFTNWMADHDLACDTYTLVLRFRNEAINPIRGNQNRVIQVGAVWTSTAGATAGFDFRMAPQETLGNVSSPRIVVGTNQQEFQNIRIQDGKWVDCAIAVSRQTLAATFCWEDGNSNVIARASYTYPTSAALPAIAANCTVRIGGAEKASCTFTRGVEISSSNWTYGFRGAFHQIAFWDRTLSDDEIREAMAGGTSRPNLVQVGIEGNGINEFATSSQTANVANDGAWEYLNPTLTSGNPTATISFTCPALWAGMPQHLRIPMAGTSSSGSVSVALNGETLGTVDVAANKAALVYIEKNKIVSGENTLAISRVSGDSLVLDAVTLGGSWRFGNAISSFSDSRDQYEPWVKSSPDRYILNPSCGSDKFHDRSLNTSGDAKTYFTFFVPTDMVGKFRGVFTTRTQNTGGSSMPYSFHVNGAKVGDFTLKGGTETTVKISDDFIVAGWNTAYWTTTSGGYWANIDWHKFELLPPPKGIVISFR